MRRSKVLEKLRAGEPVLVSSPTPYHSAKLVEMMGIIGMDCVWLDQEHQDLSEDEIVHMCLAARATDMDALVRVRKGEYYSFFRPLESGANGIVVPHVTTGEEARRAAANTKFPPDGCRGIDGVDAHALHGLQPFAEHRVQANRETFVVVQIEDAAGVDNVDEIAAAPGVDVLFIGPGDLAASLGVIGQVNHPLMVEAIDKVAQAARQAGIHWGCPVGSAERLAELREMGATFFAWGAAIIGLQTYYRDIHREFRRAVTAGADLVGAGASEKA